MSLKSQDLYRVLDVMYRIHEDLFHVEDVIQRTSAAQFKLNRIRANTGIAVLVAGFIAIIPVIVDVSGIEWASLPAIWLLCFGLGMIGLVCYQVLEIQSTNKAADSLEKSLKRPPLEWQHDYLLERVGMHVAKLRVLTEVETELAAEIQAGDTDGSLAALLERYQEVAEQCRNEINSAVSRSETLYKSKERTEAQHNQILGWSKPFRS